MDTQGTVNAYEYDQAQQLDEIISEETKTPHTDFLTAMARVAALKRTENGAPALSTSLSALLDLFGEIGALRCRSEADIISLFLAAYGEDKNLALKTLFYARDIRGSQGLGERRTFRVILHYLALNHPDDIAHLIPLIPFFGRWDDLFVLLDTPLEDTTLDLIAEQFESDLQNLNSNHLQNISLLAKWLPSVNASSKATRDTAKHLLKKGLHLSQKDYRHKLSALRAALRVIEKQMSSNNWSDINYESVPSYAALRYKLAFARHDQERYEAYLEALMHGEAKIHADTLYPYDIVRDLFRESFWNTNFTEDATQLATAQQLWNALPNYLADTPNADQRYLVMADTSGSMFDHVGSIYRSTSLAVYFAERTTGYFANTFLTFTDKPKLVKLSPELSLKEKLQIVLNPDYVGYSTNLDRAFATVLAAAVAAKVPQSELPTAILVISDMEIDQAVDFYDHDDNQTEQDVDPRSATFTERWTQKFAEAGYTLPNIVYWNVNARNNTFHATETDNVRFVSGSSAATFTTLCKTNGATPTETMLAAILDDRYRDIHI